MHQIISATKKQPSIFVLEVRLLHTDPLVWRIIHMKRNMTMLDLHCAIQAAMGWKHTHHYEFIPNIDYPRQIIGVPAPETDAELKQVVTRSDAVKISEVFIHTGDKIRYVYDLGDHWEHEVELRGMMPEENYVKYPICPSGARTCPPEDSGGIHGYRNLLRAVEENDKSALREYDVWLGGRYNPDGFRPDTQYGFYLSWKRVKKNEGFQ